MKKIFSKIIIASVLFVFILPVFFTLGIKNSDAAEEWYYTRTNNLLINLGDAIEFIKSTSVTECTTKRTADKSDPKNITLGSCTQKVQAPNEEGWGYNVDTKIAPALSNNPIGFKTEEDCNTNRNNYLKSDLHKNDTFFVSISTCTYKKGVSNNGVVNVTGKQIAAGDKYDPIYHLLAPIGTFTEIKTDDIGGYFSKIFLIAIGLCGALAVIMFVIGGIQYMGEESIWAKTKGKEQMTSAILGLLIALGSWALLNTINPDLLGGSGLLISSAKITLIDKPDAGDNTVDPDFNKGNESYSTSGAVSSGVTEAVSKLKNSSSISSFNVSTSSKTMTITMGDGFSTQSVPIDIGLGGVSEVGAGITGDNKTPKGNWKILEVRTSAGGKPVFSKKGSNMGASFWLLSPTTNGDRGIGMHGNKNGTLSITNGCIRLKNSDILALLPYIKSGISVNIQ